MRGTCIILIAAAGLGWAWGGVEADGPESRPASQPADDLDYWIGRAEKAQSAPADALAEAPGGSGGRPAGREDALPGVVEMSDGSVTPGWLYGTREKPWEVYDEAHKQWRQVPLLAVLGVRAVVKEERMELRWRWKGMGEPEKVYTGAKYPYRRLEWQVRLIDGSSGTGAVQGQPLYLEPAGGGDKRVLVLQERQAGPDGQALKDLLYVRRVIVSKRLMDLVIADAKQAPKGSSSTRPAPAGKGKR